ncbi:sulfotransferase family 2 domain-containing protein [Microbaculum marinum]|uniref:Sulfotransferase family 2 domain-containing protein n=1 Tax=Microbaculum marinum TaxID=1764581 RepID=A0AAW9RSX7_9HYPH
MPKVVFVVGAHRSGTSALAGALGFCGYQHSPQLMPAAADNPVGFWEPLPIVRLNQRLLEIAGASWDRIPLWLDFSSLSRRRIGDWCANGFAEPASAAWDDAFGGVEGDIVCKDPRLSLTLPLWLQTAEDKGYDPDVLISHRAPDRIAASLTRRNGHDFAAALDLVMDYWSNILANAPRSARVVRYESLVAAPEHALGRVGFAPASEAARRDLLGFVRNDDTNSAAGVFPKPILPHSLAVLNDVLASADGACLLRETMPFLTPFERGRDEHKRFCGQVYLLPPSEPVKSFTIPARRRRKVVLHCHIFKNAGSSVDVVLKENFGARWTEKEFQTRPRMSNADLTNGFLRTHDHYDAVSTHTGDWWFGHDDQDLTVLPILFLRHPLLRIRSAYSFERKQQADTLGARLAKEHDFPGYVRARLDRPNDFAFRDFQARRLAAFQSRITTDLWSTAMRALEALPFVGLVEDFEGSAKRLEAYLKPHFPDFRAYEAHRNVTDLSNASPQDKIARLAEELGEELFDKLLAANATDIEIYQLTEAQWGTRSPVAGKALAE